MPTITFAPHTTVPNSLQGSFCQQESPTKDFEVNLQALEQNPGKLVLFHQFYERAFCLRSDGVLPRELNQGILCGIESALLHAKSKERLSAYHFLKLMMNAPNLMQGRETESRECVTKLYKDLRVEDNKMVRQASKVSAWLHETGALSGCIEELGMDRVILSSDKHEFKLDRYFWGHHCKAWRPMLIGDWPQGARIPVGLTLKQLETVDWCLKDLYPFFLSVDEVQEVLLLADMLESDSLKRAALNALSLFVFVMGVIEYPELADRDFFTPFDQVSQESGVEITLFEKISIFHLSAVAGENLLAIADLIPRLEIRTPQALSEICRRNIPFPNVLDISILFDITQDQMNALGALCPNTTSLKINRNTTVLSPYHLMNWDSIQVLTYLGDSVLHMPTHHFPNLYLVVATAASVLGSNLTMKYQSSDREKPYYVYSPGASLGFDTLSGYVSNDLVDAVVTSMGGDDPLLNLRGCTYVTDELFTLEFIHTLMRLGYTKLDVRGTQVTSQKASEILGFDPMIQISFDCEPAAAELAE